MGGRRRGRRRYAGGKELKLSPRQREALEIVADGKFYPCLAKEEDGWYARWRAVGADNDWVDEYVREATMTRLSEDAEYQRHPTLHDAWLMALRSRTGRVDWDDAECAAFAKELEAWSGAAASDAEARKSIVFSLEAEGERFHVSCAVPRGRRGLRALGLAAYVWGALRGLRAAGAPKGRLRVELTRGEAEDFVRRGAIDLRDAGYGVKGADLAATVSAEAEIDTPSAPPDGKKPKGPGHTVRLVVRVAGEAVTADEIRFLLDQGSTLVYFRDHWIEVDRGILKEALRALEKGTDRKANPLSFALGLGHVGRLEIEEVRAHGWLRGLVNELRTQGKRVADISADEPDGFDGALRNYQREGVAWLTFLTSHGFGALLADEMGLGKTVQVIAWMLEWRMRGGKGPVLIAAPLTLLANWEHEFAQFAPGLRTYVHQGENRHVASGFRRVVGEADVVLTSYTLLVKDYTHFSETQWSALVLDEAQAIKNPDTQAARAVRALAPQMRIALTGTPIENSVADLWSIEEFLNPGFLGERRSFEERFARPIAADEHCAAAKRLRRALEPFVMRRLKTEPGVAAELGEKREIREYCPLYPAQRREYDGELESFRAGEHAQGDVFALLTRLKLVCDGFDGDKVEGAKLERLVELVGQILENGESALVFTQYAKVGAAIQKALAERFSRRFPFMHGGLEASARAKLVRGFQNTSRPDVFILSLKSGGFGLNLTKATHVIHYDRWWNPAVESQATDRAHRIGQTKTVFVHLFVAAGTIEERVDEMLRRKESLRDLIADGQAFWRAALGADLGAASRTARDAGDRRAVRDAFPDV